MAELELAEVLLQSDWDRNKSSQLLTLLSCDPRNCHMPQAHGSGSIRKWEGY